MENIIKNKKVKKTNVNKSSIRSKGKNIRSKMNIKTSKKSIRPIILVDYIFLLSLILSIVFGMQTNSSFLIPFTITLITTIVCMGIIIVNAIYIKIKKKIKK